MPPSARFRRQPLWVAASAGTTHSGSMPLLTSRDDSVPLAYGRLGTTHSSPMPLLTIARLWSILSN